MSNDHIRPRPAATPSGAPRPLSAAVALVFLALACAPDGPGGEEGHEAEAHAHDVRLGAVHFPSSCEPAARAEVERGVALLHHMMYVEAERAFEAVLEREESCAMAHWGVAMAQFQPMWPTRPSAELLARGRAHADRAAELAPSTERERAYVDAVRAFYDGSEVAYPARLQLWADAMADLHERFPEDREAAAFHALALISTAPAGDRTFRQQVRASEILEAIYAEEPSHPGGVHYAIHAHDLDGRAPDAVEYAEAYEGIAPTVPHALHMPSHIFVRLGGWEEVIDWNQRSADAALRHPAGDRVSHHYPHAIDYLMYAHLQRGEDGKARAVRDELMAKDEFQPTFISAYALAAVPARWHVERRDWAGAARLEARVPASFPWDGSPGAEAMTHFARGLGAARSGDPEGARAAMERLEELRDAASRAADEYWAMQIEIQRLGVAAWVALAEGNREDAVRRMRSAAEMEANTEKHPVTPGALQPAYELLGDLLLEVDRPAEALAAYERSLQAWPRRYHSLRGAARAAERAGEPEEARRYRDEFADLASDADPERDAGAEPTLDP